MKVSMTFRLGDRSRTHLEHVMSWLECQRTAAIEWALEQAAKQVLLEGELREDSSDSDESQQ